MMIEETPHRVVRMASHQHRVLLYTTCYHVLDGVTLTIRKLEQEILAAGHSVCILTTNSGDPRNSHIDGEHPNRRVIFMDNAKPIPFVHDPNNPDLTYQIGFALSPTVLEQIEDFEPSIIHITCPDCTALHLIQYARTREIPLMGTYHSNIPEYMDHYPGLSWLKHILGAFFRHQYNFLQALYVPTPFIQKHLTDAYKLDRATSLDVWGRGVDIDKFNPSHRSLKFRRDLGISDNDVVVCWVGRLVPEKRVDIFSHVIRHLANRNDVSFHALVVGAGPCEDEIKALPHTTFCGWMNADQLSVAYASSDVFLFPSSVETFGNVTLEAMASGLPVIVEQGCSGHLVRNDENGYACPSDDPNAFFEATLQVVADENKRRSFSETSRYMSTALEKRAVVRKMLHNYSRVTDEFYTEYGGHHANRDSVYQRPGSFVGGNYPRPFFLAAVEGLFVVLFQVIWNMTEVFMYMQETFGSVQRQRWSVVETEESSIVTASTFSSVSPTRAVATKGSSSDQLEVQEPPVIDDGMADVDLEDPLADDDATASTVSYSSEHDEHETSCFCMPRSNQACGDRQFAHALAKGFVRTVEFQCRMESHLRNGCSRCCSTAYSVESSKRKNSSFGLVGIEMRPDPMSRVRSEASDITLADDTSSLGFDGQSCMRRGRSEVSELQLGSEENSLSCESRMRRNQAVEV